MSEVQAAIDPLLEACIAAATTCHSQLTAAADAWVESPANMTEPLRAAELARDRIDAYLGVLRQTLPSHARRARSVALLAERASLAVRAAWGLPKGFTSDEEEDEEAEEEALESLDRAMKAFQRTTEALRNCAETV